jgi:hypothetical protein
LPEQRCTIASVAGHAMYERANPFYENFLGGRIDMSRCHYEQYGRTHRPRHRADIRPGRGIAGSNSKVRSRLRLWSGRACGFRLPALAAAGELEHPVCSIYPGTLLARPDRGEVLMSYGAAEYRSVLGVEYGTQLGRLVGNRDTLLAVLARMHDEGDKRIVIRRAAAA